MTFASRLRIPTLAAAALLCFASAAQAQDRPAHHPAGAHPHSQPHHDRSHAHEHDKKHHKAHGKHHHKDHHKDHANSHGPHGAHPSTRPAMNEWEKNALRRCDVFKTDVERDACAARVRAPVASGSVAGGGVLREHVITVPVPR